MSTVAEMIPTNDNEVKVEARPQMNERTQNSKTEKLEPQGSNQTGSWKEQFSEWSKHVPLRPVNTAGRNDGRAVRLAE